MDGIKRDELTNVQDDVHNINDLDKLKEWFISEIKRRDKQIEDLEFKNKLLMKSALKSSERVNSWTNHVEKLEQEKRKLENDISLIKSKR